MKARGRRFGRRWILGGLALLGLGSGALAAQERAPGVKRLQFLIEVDLERARSIGWTGRDDPAVVRLAAALVEKRFLAMERAVRVELVPDARRFRVSLTSLDSSEGELFRGMLRSMGVCELMFPAEEERTAERLKLDAWRATHPEAALDEFNALAGEQGGPAKTLAWFRTVWLDPKGALSQGEPTLARLPAEAWECVGAQSFESASPSSDPFGWPGIAAKVRQNRVEDCRRLTASHLDQRLCIVLENVVRTVPSLNRPIDGNLFIEGRFTSVEAERLAKAMNALEGPLRLVDER